MNDFANYLSSCRPSAGFFAQLECIGFQTRTSILHKGALPSPDDARFAPMRAKVLTWVVDRWIDNAWASDLSLCLQAQAAQHCFAATCNMRFSLSFSPVRSDRDFSCRAVFVVLYKFLQIPAIKRFAQNAGFIKQGYSSAP